MPDPEVRDVLVTIGHPFGDVEVTLQEWMRTGPGPRPLVRHVKARSRATGEALPPTVIPLACRNDEEARALIEAGMLASPWPAP